MGTADYAGTANYAETWEWAQLDLQSIQHRDYFGHLSIFYGLHFQFQQRGMDDLFALFTFEASKNDKKMPVLTDS